MKIKEVCQRTGLSEETIRYYSEEVIDNTAYQTVDRKRKNFSEQDVAELAAVAFLREMSLSLEEIKEMQHASRNIVDIAAGYKASFAEQEDERTKPDFGRLDGQSQEERDREYELSLKRQNRKFQVGRAIVFSIAALNAVSSILLALVSFNLIIVIIEICLSIALVCGVSWVRYLFIAGAVLSIIREFTLLTQTDGLSLSLVLIILLQMVYSGAVGYLLLASSAVNSFYRPEERMRSKR